MRTVTATSTAPPGGSTSPGAQDTATEAPPGGTPRLPAIRPASACAPSVSHHPARAVWRATSRAIASTADAAALAAASAVDEDRYRSTAEVVLVPRLAEQRAQASLRAQLDTAPVQSSRVTVEHDHATVTVRGHVGFTLLRLLGDGGFDIEVTSTATPARST